MSGRRGRSRRRSGGPRASWWTRGNIVRLVIAIVLVALIWPVARTTLGFRVRGASPQLAMKLAPDDARVMALRAEQMFGTGEDAAARARAVALARQAIARDPTLPSPFALIGLDASLRGDTATARRLMRHSERLSRRDLRTQLWLIEDAVARDDVPEALLHYDRALRTSRAAPELMFPVLASAIADPELRGELAKVLRRQPAWGPAFLFSAGAGPEPAAAAMLLASLRRTGYPLPDGVEDATMSGLVDRGDPMAAWRYYAAAHGNPDRSTNRDPRFADQQQTAPPFEWLYTNDAGISAAPIREGARSLLDFQVGPQTAGAIVRQLQVLPPGSYRLVGRVDRLAQPADSRPAWTVTCVGGAELARIPMSSRPEASGPFAGDFTVPAGCAAQWLALVAAPTDDIQGISGAVAELRVVRR